MLTLESVHAARWWCPYDRAWMSSTITFDADYERVITCLNCGGVITRFKEQTAYAGVQ